MNLLGVSINVFKLVFDRFCETRKCFTLETQNLAKRGMLMMQMLKNISLANIFYSVP